jgi:hypothetical protein
MHLFNTKRLEQDESLGLQVPEKNLLYNTRDKLKTREHSSILFETCVPVYACKICE